MQCFFPCRQTFLTSSCLLGKVEWWLCDKWTTEISLLHCTLYTLKRIVCFWKSLIAYSNAPCNTWSTSNPIDSLHGPLCRLSWTKHSSRWRIINGINNYMLMWGWKTRKQITHFHVIFWSCALRCSNHAFNKLGHLLGKYNCRWHGTILENVEKVLLFYVNACMFRQFYTKNGPTTGFKHPR